MSRESLFSPVVRRVLVLTGGIALSLVFGSHARAQESATVTEYRTPDQVLVDIVDAPLTPGVSMSPDNEWMVQLRVTSYPPIAELAERELKLAGMRINPAVNGPSRARYYRGLKFVRMSDLRETPVTGLPSEPRLGSLSWSPDGRLVLFTHTTSHGIELWVADVETGAADRLTEPTLNLTIADSPRWLSDSRTILTTFVPESRGAQEPDAPTVPRAGLRGALGIRP